jgi:hypothetical protein
LAFSSPLLRSLALASCRGWPLRRRRGRRCQFNSTQEMHNERADDAMRRSGTDERTSPHIMR